MHTFKVNSGKASTVWSFKKSEQWGHMQMEELSSKPWGGGETLRFGKGDLIPSCKLRGINDLPQDLNCHSKGLALQSFKHC